MEKGDSEMEGAANSLIENLLNQGQIMQVVNVGGGAEIQLDSTKKQRKLTIPEKSGSPLDVVEGEKKNGGDKVKGDAVLKLPKRLQELKILAEKGEITGVELLEAVIAFFDNSYAEANFLKMKGQNDCEAKICLPDYMVTNDGADMAFLLKILKDHSCELAICINRDEYLNMTFAEYIRMITLKKCELAICDELIPGVDVGISKKVIRTILGCKDSICVPGDMVLQSEGDSPVPLTKEEKKKKKEKEDKDRKDAIAKDKKEQLAQKERKKNQERVKKALEAAKVSDEAIDEILDEKGSISDLAAVEKDQVIVKKSILSEPAHLLVGAAFDIVNLNIATAKGVSETNYWKNVKSKIADLQQLNGWKKCRKNNCK